MNDNPFIQQGWQCPICNRIYSPQTSICLYCNKERSTFASTKTNPLVINDLSPYISDLVKTESEGTE